MTGALRLRVVKATLALTGVVSLCVWPLMKLWPSGWSWHPHGSNSEQMVVVVYMVLGVFLLKAVRRPLRHRSLIWFTAWSSLAHGSLMAWQSLSTEGEHGHMVGDVPALFLVFVLLAVFMPRGARADALEAQTR